MVKLLSDRQLQILTFQKNILMGLNLVGPTTSLNQGNMPRVNWMQRVIENTCQKKGYDY